MGNNEGNMRALTKNLHIPLVMIIPFWPKKTTVQLYADANF